MNKLFISDTHFGHDGSDTLLGSRPADRYICVLAQKRRWTKYWINKSFEGKV